MKAIFLSDAKETLLNVYAPSIREKLSALVSLDGTVYGKQDVLSSPDAFANIEIIFSTWGMPSFAEEEIARIFRAFRPSFTLRARCRALRAPFLQKASVSFPPGRPTPFLWQNTPLRKSFLRERAFLQTREKPRIRQAGVRWLPCVVRFIAAITARESVLSVAA